MGRSIGFLAGLMLLLSGCMQPSGVRIFRWESYPGTSALLAICEPVFGWDEPTLVDTCGVPILEAPMRGDPSAKCLVYDNAAHSIHTADAPSPYVAVCLATTTRTKASRPRSRKDDRDPEPPRTETVTTGTVRAIYGLSRLPDLPAP